MPEGYRKPLLVPLLAFGTVLHPLLHGSVTLLMGADIVAIESTPHNNYGNG